MNRLATAALLALAACSSDPDAPADPDFPVCLEECTKVLDNSPACTRDARFSTHYNCTKTSAAKSRPSCITEQIDACELTTPQPATNGPNVMTICCKPTP